MVHKTSKTEADVGGPDAGDPVTAATAPTAYRHDIQALRALAIVLVLVFHAFPSTLRGGFIGVDVFFVLSGFLITSQLLRFSPMSLSGVTTFYTRRIRRLVPHAFVVLVATITATIVFAPPTLWSGWKKEFIASALYLENWQLVRSSSDYNAAQEGASPVQHYWSLAIEEQFYLVLPAIVLITGLLRHHRRVLLLVVLAITAYSLGLSATWRPEASDIAYFNTLTRAWELGLGALAAFASFAFARHISAVLCGIGLSAIVLPATLYSTSGFPGYKALAPCLGTVAIILAGSSLSTRMQRILAARPIQWVGDRSYGIYLWHWPVLVIAPHAGLPNGTLGGWLAIGISVLLAAIFYPAERLLHHGKRHPGSTTRLLPWAAATALATSVVVALASFLLVPQSRTTSPPPSASPTVGKVDDARPCFGAAAMLPGSKCKPTGQVVPDPIDAAKNLPDERCKAALASSEVLKCTFGSGRTRVALVGDSHAQRWLAALKLIADKRGWTITTYLKGSCPFSTVPLRRFNKSCSAWNAAVADELKKTPPDLLFSTAASGTNYDAPSGESSDAAGKRGAAEQWRNTGVRRIVVLRDNPLPGFARLDPPACVSTKAPSECTFPRKDAVKVDAQAEAAKSFPGASVIDLTDYFCSGDTCHSVIGGVLVYKDGQHVIDTYAQSLSPMIDAQLTRILND